MNGLTCRVINSNSTIPRIVRAVEPTVIDDVDTIVERVDALLAVGATSHRPVLIQKNSIIITNVYLPKLVKLYLARSTHHARVID